MSTDDWFKGWLLMNWVFPFLQMLAFFIIFAVGGVVCMAINWVIKELRK